LLQGKGVSLSLAESAPCADHGDLPSSLQGLVLPSRTRVLLGQEASVGNGLEAKVLRTAGEELRHLAELLRDGVDRPDPFRRRVMRLVGLGSGSTPTGDDLLVGLTAATWRLVSAGLVPRSSQEGFHASLDALPPNATTDTGLEMLAHAVRGAFPEPLKRLVESLGVDDTSVVTARVNRLSRLGGRSGCDMLAGVVGVLNVVAAGQCAFQGPNRMEACREGLSSSSSPK
jgi:hypothetical protein